MLTDEMVFWSDEEECNTNDHCENFIENILEYMFDDYVLELDIEELYDKSLEQLEIVEYISFINIYYDSMYKSIV